MLRVCKGKGKGVPEQARCGPEGSRRFRLPDFHDIWHTKVARSSRSCRKCSRYSFSLGAESEGDMSLKNPVTPPGIDPGTVRLVAQRVNHYATLGPGPRL